jgi:hypothetical protein
VTPPPKVGPVVISHDIHDGPLRWNDTACLLGQSKQNIFKTLFETLKELPSTPTSSSPDGMRIIDLDNHASS